MGRRSAFRNAFEYGAVLAAAASLRCLPMRAARRLAGFYARLLDLAIPRLRRVAERNLEMAFPRENPGWRREVIDGVFRSVGRVLLALARFPEIGTHNVSQWIGYEGWEHWEEAKRRGKGVLFATAHLGNWELSAYAHALMAEPMNVVVRPLDNPWIDRWVERRRSASGNRVIGKKDFARGILGALKRNEAVGILIDQNASSDGGAFVDFFGVPACAGTGFAKFAAHSGAAVIPGFALWREAEQRYVLRFHRALEMTGDAEADTAALHRVLEAVIRENPDQWLWIHRRWKTRPPGEPPLYP